MCDIIKIFDNNLYHLNTIDTPYINIKTNFTCSILVVVGKSFDLNTKVLEIVKRLRIDDTDYAV